ncbi:MAG TPA: two-component sensor histidine kinase [Clostridiaceae bacterium]|nr:two-component sensor histidine kinase [Clostridiaceae bacterium]
MKRNSISFKLFITTIIFFIIFISATMLVQSLFFEKFYAERKTRVLRNNLDKFKTLYQSSNHNIQDIIEPLRKFQDSNNAQLVIMNRNKIFDYNLISGSIFENSDPSREQIMRAAIMQWGVISRTYRPEIEGGKDIVYNIKHPVFKTDNIVIISPVVSRGKVSDVIFAVSSLQPVGEAAAAMNEFYIYIYLGLVILVVILSFIYSSMVSKPLVSLNNTALKMAELDFSSKCEVKSNDEIGNLSSTLNFLSDKLGTTLKELKSANEKLQADIDKERSIEKMRKEFIAGVSHELKTPVSLIEGYAEGLKDNIVEGEDRDFYMDVIIDEAKNMGKLVNDMLDLSQLDSGNYKLSQHPFIIDSFISYIVKKYSNLLHQKDITLNMKFENENIQVFGDKFRIEQVIINMLNNAIKHTPEGGLININIMDGDDIVTVEIENQGEHIGEEDMENIWDRFYRTDKSRSRDSGGTGLGLAIAKDILLLHQSSFGVVNTDLGVKFYFTLKKVK